MDYHVGESVPRRTFWLRIVHRQLVESQTDRDDLLALSLKLSRTPCGPLYKGAIFPDKALKELVLR